MATVATSKSTPEAQQIVFGGLSASAIGIILKEAVRRAIKEIRLARLDFEIHQKPSADSRPDFFTTADTNAQEIYMKIIREALPGVGIIAEESAGEATEPFRLECTVAGRQIYIIVDPLDGTRAFIRRQDTGVATQVALVEFYEDGTSEVLAAFVGDVNTGVIYGYRPYSSKVHRIFDFDRSQYLHTIDRNIPLTGQHAVLRQRLDSHNDITQALLRPVDAGGLVGGHTIANGSMSLTASQLWTGEMGMMVMPPNNETPWDLAPIAGILDRLGYRTYRLSGSLGSIHLELAPLAVRAERYGRNDDLICIHASREAELTHWVKNN